jgi:hypothetical protein
MDEAQGRSLHSTRRQSCARTPLGRRGLLRPRTVRSAMGCVAPGDRPFRPMTPVRFFLFNNTGPSAGDYRKECPRQREFATEGVTNRRAQLRRSLCTQYSVHKFRIHAKAGISQLNNSLLANRYRKGDMGELSAAVGIGQSMLLTRIRNIQSSTRRQGCRASQGPPECIRWKQLRRASTCSKNPQSQPGPRVPDDNAPRPSTRGDH